MISNKYQGDNTAFPESIDQWQPSNARENQKELEKTNVELEEE